MNSTMTVAQFQGRFSKSFLTDILKKHLKDDVGIINFTTTHVTPPGENFICELLRIVVNYTDSNGKNKQSISMITKCLIEKELVLKMDKEMGLYSRELDVYANVLPIMEDFDCAKKIAPKVYHVSKESKRMLVIEDLQPLNYVMANCRDGLNLEHCLLVVEKLAYLHASSLVMYQKDPKSLEKFNQGSYNKTKVIHEILTIVVKETTNVCKEMPRLQKYCSKLNNNKLIEKCYTSTNRDPIFNVLNHGDFWCNNMMFQYNSNKNPTDVVFIDFQLSVFTSPFFDLHYFLATSANSEVIREHIRTVVNFYYCALVKYLQVLKIKTNVPSKEDFYQGFCNKAFIGVATVYLALPFVKAPKRDDATVANFMEVGGECSFRHDCFNNPKYLNTLQDLLKLYDSFGVFDC